MVEINLLPWREQSLIQVLKKIQLLIFLIINLLIYLAANFYQNIMIHHYQSVINHLKDQIVLFDKSKFIKLNEERINLIEKINNLIYLKNFNSQWLEILHYLEIMLPPELTLTSLARIDTTWQLKGLALSHDKVMTLLDQLDQAIYFNKSVLKSLQPATDLNNSSINTTLYEFEIELHQK